MNIVTGFFVDKFVGKLTNSSMSNSTKSVSKSIDFFWTNLIDYETWKIIDEIWTKTNFNMDIESSQCNLKTETYVYDHEICDVDNDFDQTQTNYSVGPFVNSRNKDHFVYSSINLDSHEDEKIGTTAAFQVEVVDGKLSYNVVFGKCLTRCLFLDYSEMQTMKDDSNPIEESDKSLDFLLKVDKVPDDIINLLWQHKLFKDCCGNTSREVIKDRRLISIEQSIKCSIDFPIAMKIIRFKGVNCIRLKITSKSNLNNIKVVNLIKAKLPKLYSECIFKYPSDSLTNSSLIFSLDNTPVRRSYLIERPFTRNINSNPLKTKQFQSDMTQNSIIHSTMNSFKF